MIEQLMNNSKIFFLSVNQIQTIVQIEPSCMTSTKTGTLVLKTRIVLRNKPLMLLYFSVCSSDLLIPTCCCVSLKTQVSLWGWCDVLQIKLQQKWPSRPSLTPPWFSWRTNGSMWPQGGSCPLLKWFMNSMFFSCTDRSPGAPATAAAFSDQAVAATELRQLNSIVYFLLNVKRGLQEQPLIFQLIFRVYFDVIFITDHLLHWVFCNLRL